jgi:hypothetical protein
MPSMNNYKSKPNMLKVKERKWKWIGHKLKSENNIDIQTFSWNPQGKERQDARETHGEKQY